VTERDHSARILAVYVLVLLQVILLGATGTMLLYVSHLRSEVAVASSLRCHAIVTSLDILRSNSLSGVRPVAAALPADTPPSLRASFESQRRATIVENAKRRANAKRASATIDLLLASPFCDDVVAIAR
jgi:hypothetical protein